MSASGAWTASACMVRYGSNHTGRHGSSFTLIKNPFREASPETAATSQNFMVDFTRTSKLFWVTTI
ncbi:MAG: hypothetical protein H0U04_13655 [Rubrobacter sp.]|nr:hypothetical protein [Rubrobacter sp.]